MKKIFKYDYILSYENIFLKKNKSKPINSSIYPKTLNIEEGLGY